MFKHCLIVFLVSMVPIIELRAPSPTAWASACPCG